MAVSRVANSGTFKVTTPSDRGDRLTRLFDAPRQLVFEAMTGPSTSGAGGASSATSYSVTVCEIDLRAGRRVALRRTRTPRARRRSTACTARSPRPSAWSSPRSSIRFPTSSRW